MDKTVKIIKKIQENQIVDTLLQPMNSLCFNVCICASMMRISACR